MYLCMHVCGAPMNACMHVQNRMCFIWGFSSHAPTEGSEEEALLAAIKAVLKCYVEKNAKDLMWKQQLARVCQIEASEVTF